MYSSKVGRRLSIWRGARTSFAAVLFLSGLFAVFGAATATPSAAADTPVSSLVDGPQAIANDGSHLWIVNSLYNEVTELNLDGSFVQNFPAGTAPVAVAADGTDVWVADSVTATVTELTATGALVRTINVGGQPTGISSDGTDVWVAEGPNDLMVEIDAQSGNLVNAIGVDGDPIGVSSDGTNVWIANSQSNDVLQYNIAQGRTVNTINVGNAPTGIFSDGTYVWIANTGDGTITVLNASDGSDAFGTDTAPIPVGNDPTGIQFDGADAWVTNTSDGTVTELAITGGVLAAGPTLAVGNGPTALATSGSDVWVDNTGDGTVSELDAATGHVLTTRNVVDDAGLQSQTIPVGSWPSSVSSDGADVWVTDNSDDTVTELNAATSAVLQTIAVGNDPDSVSSDGTHVWVVNEGDGTVTVLNASDGSYAFGTQNSAIDDPNGPLSITSDGTHVWILNSDGTIMVLNANDGTFAFGTNVTPLNDAHNPLSVTSDGTHVWLVNADETITVLNASDGTFAFGTQNAPIFDPDAASAVASDGSHVWLANSDGTLTVLNASDGSFAFGTGSSALALNLGCPSAVASNGVDVWVTSQCTSESVELDATTGVLTQTINLEYSPVAMSLDDSGDVWFANAYVGNAFSIQEGNTGSYDGANDPNDQGTITEFSAPPAFVSSSTASVQTDTFNYSPNVQTFTVPAGVTQLTLSASGGEGGRGGRDASGRPPLGGYQGVVSGTIAVTPGEVLTIGVGHGGHDSPIAQDCFAGLNSLFDAQNAIGGSNPLGGYSGGNGAAAGESGCSGYGGAGGAASVIELGSSTSPTGVATIVAGGSGGAGGSGQYPRTLGQISLSSFQARTDVTSTDGQAGVSVFNACMGASSCDGGGGAAGGGGAQGGAQGLVEFGSGESNEWFGLGASPGANATGALSGLNATYQFASGDGANGAVVISYATGLPGIPTNLADLPSTSTVAVTWSAPSVIGSSALVDYMIRYSSNDGATWTPLDLHSTLASTTLNLANGANYVYEVAAVNHSGQGGWSVLASPPTAPTLTGIVAGNSLVSVTFSSGANGGSPITGYQYSLNSGLTWENANGVGSPLSISGLTNGTSYTVVLRAVNAAGTGGASNSETATPFTVPSTPDATTFVTTSRDGQIGVSWALSNANGSPVSEYTVTLFDASFAGDQVASCDVSDLTCFDGNSTNVSGLYSISDCTLTSLTCTISGLTNYTTYWVSIQALNGAGASGRSAPRVPAIPALVSVSYDPNGGTGAISATSYEVGLPGINLPAAGVTKYGFELSGWSTVPNDVTTEVTTPYVPPSPVSPATTAYQTLYALWTPAPQYGVTYDGNGNTGGAVPVDPSSPYYADTDATVLGNTGSLVDRGFLFNGWNTLANGLGTAYGAGASLDVIADTVLYAQWTPAPQYSVTYDGNGNTGGAVPVDASSPYYAQVDATVLGNTGDLLDTGYVFAGWNTQATGQGTTLVAGSLLDVTANTVLYALWTPIQWLPPAPPITLPPTPASTPPGLAIDPVADVTGTSGVLLWSPPSSDGGSPITGYTVTNAQGDVVCTTTTLSCNVSDLVGSGPFEFTITATNAMGSGLGESFSAHVTPLTCGGVGASKCPTHKRNVVFGIFFFRTGQYAITATAASHAMLETIVKSLIAHHVRSVTVSGAADSRGSVSQNDALSLRRARSTVAALRALLRSLHDSLPRFVVRSEGVSTKYVGLAKNRRTTVSGVIDT